MRRWALAPALLCLALEAGPADPAPRRYSIERVPAKGIERATIRYSPLQVPLFQAQDASSIAALIKGTMLRLTLRDAIALAVANNLDVEVQRFGMLLADADLLRARGGGVVRGLNYTVGEVAPGVGGPASSLLNGVASRFAVNSAVPSNLTELGVLTGGQSNLSMLGGTALSNGTAVPNYEPSLTGLLNWAHQSAPQATFTSYGTNNLVTNTLTANSGFQQAFTTGTQLAAAFNNARQTWNSYRGNYSPYTASTFGFSVTQPLLRGFGRDVNQRFIRIAGNEQRITSLLFQQQLIATVYGVTRLYLDLAALSEDIKVKQQTLSLAEKLRDDTKAHVEEGTQPEIELTRANAQIAAARQDLIAARGLYEEQEAILKSVITRKGLNDPAVAKANIEVADPLEAPGAENKLDAEKLLDYALSHRPDLAQAGLQLENSELSLKGSRNALRPQVDLVGSMQNNGFAGQANPLFPGGDLGLQGSYGNVIEQLLARNYPSYGVGVQVSLPLRNRVAQADAARDQVQVRQSQARLAQMRNQVRLEIEAALIALRRTRNAYQAAVETRTLQEQSLAAEQARYDEGLSTSFFLLQYQNLLAQARSAEVIARGAYSKARAALQRATGDILDAAGVSVEQAKAAH